MRREKLEHLVTTGLIKGKRNRGKQQEKVLNEQTKLLKEGRVTHTLKATRDRDSIFYPWQPKQVDQYTHTRINISLVTRYTLPSVIHSISDVHFK